MDMEIFEVGGCVRDKLLGIPTNDIDFVVVLDPERFADIEGGFSHMVNELETAEFKIWQTTPDKVAVRAQFPESMRPMFDGVRDADFVLARTEGPYSDGRRPDWVKVGTLAQDLIERRDFTVNAIAKAADGTLIDLSEGLKDLESKTLRFIGDPMERITQDAVRVLRGLRFHIVKGFNFDPITWEAMNTDETASLILNIAEERRDKELSKMFEFDTIGSMAVMADMNPKVVESIFDGRVKLTGSLAKTKVKG